jgi:hypothetical protein
MSGGKTGGSKASDEDSRTAVRVGEYSRWHQLAKYRILV